MSTFVCDLIYREKGEKKSRQLKIEFVSNYMRREIAEYFQLATQVKFQWDGIGNTLSEMASVKVLKEEGYKAKLAELEEKKNKLSDDILKHNNTGLATKNVELVVELLKDNGYKDEHLIDLKWWDKCVEPSEVIKILNGALEKDINSKKKV